MKITIYCIGKLKENYWKDACAEYLKRLKPYADTSIVELPDYPCKQNASEAEITAVKEKEGKHVIDLLSPSDYLIALDLNKKQYDSVSFSAHLEEAFRRGGSNLYFVIGGSMGLSDELKKRANESLTLSELTFPHQLTRVILLEQLYRAFRISHNEPYHK